MSAKMTDENAPLRQELQELREEITKTDEEMARLFTERMEISAQIAEVKRKLGLPVFDPAREEENLRAAESRVSPEWLPYYKAFLRQLMDLSKALQETHFQEET